MSKREDELVEMIQEVAALTHAPKGHVALGIGDDAALWTPAAGRKAILTCDWFLEGTHFLREKHPADAVGWKCLARAVSDIAAMGATPRCFLLSLALPRALTEMWLNEFLRGLRRAAKAFRCELAGGDTTRQEKVLINITAIGEVVGGKALLRSGARPGDGIYVSGRLGEAELGLRMLRKKRGMAKATNAALRKHLYPQPRLELGEWLTKRGFASAMMDLSDGLSTDLQRLCEASRVGARIDEMALPVSSLVSFREGAKVALSGGDDYELLFTVGKGKRMPRQFGGLRLTQIGEITREKEVVLNCGAGKMVRMRARGWDPFRV